MSIAENVALVRERIEAAALSCGRRPEEIRLVAASKMNGAARVREAYTAGIHCFGENRVQEYREKDAEHAYDGAEVHIIGCLQRNKAKYVAGRVELIQSVDSVELMRELQRLCEKRDAEQRVLLEVNLAGEASKTGCPLGELPRLLEAAAENGRVKVCGLMGIAPISGSEAENRTFFADMYQLFVDIRAKKYDNISMVELSMGMSGDFEAAIREGATMVRVGSSIFGARNYENPG